MPPRKDIGAPPRIERRSQSVPPTFVTGETSPFRPITPVRLPSSSYSSPSDTSERELRPISLPYPSEKAMEMVQPRQLRRPQPMQQASSSSAPSHAFPPQPSLQGNQRSAFNRVTPSRSPSPVLSDAFDERTIGNHFGRYPTSTKTSEAKGKHAYKDAQKTFQKRQNDPNPPKVNSKIYLSPRREKQVAADYAELIKSGATQGRVKTRGRLAESGKTLGNPKKSSLELHFKRNDDPLAATLGRTQDPRMGHLERVKRISSLPRDDYSSSSDSD